MPATDTKQRRPRLHAVQDPGSPFVIEFFETTIEGSPAAREHDALGWFTVEELRDMSLAPADAHFVAQLARREHGSRD